MNRLTPIFLAGALAMAGGLAVLQGQLPAKAVAPAEHSMPGTDMSGAKSALAAPSTQGFAADQLPSEVQMD